MTGDQYRLVRSCLAGRIAEIQGLIERGELHGVPVERWRESVQAHEECLQALAEDARQAEAQERAQAPSVCPAGQ
ncbi:MAG: hypothetical protein IJ089_03880 [Clostridia bacterium]|nr:hypothetical protein [Clostridia bacterium]